MAVIQKSGEALRWPERETKIGAWLVSSADEWDGVMLRSTDRDVLL